jgi:hypothetical protein
LTPNQLWFPYWTQVAILIQSPTGFFYEQVVK